MSDVCLRCGQPIPPPKTHVYAVRVQTGSGKKKWMYSLPVTREEANVQSLELQSTGYETRVLTVRDAADLQRRYQRKVSP